MYTVSIVLVAIFMSTTLVKSNDSLIADSIIVSEINKFREDLVCLEAALNMELISSDIMLSEYANDVINRRIERNISLTHIIPNTCSYQLSDTISLENNVMRFIRNCISKVYRRGNSSVSWLWDYKYTQIGCAYSPKTIFCVLKETENQSKFDTPIIVTDQSKYDTNLLKQNGALFTNECPLLQRLNYKSCYLLTSTRNYIISELNRFRENSIDNGLAEVGWDSALEISAIEFSKYKSASWADDCFTIASHPNGFVIQEFEPNIHFLIHPNLDTEIFQFIDDSDKPNRGLYAIGCTYFTVNTKGILLCVWNKDKSTMTAILLCLNYLRHNLIENLNFLYITIFILLLNIIIIVLFMKAARNFEKHNKASWRKTAVESIYSKVTD